jgi:hypothetical protein
MSMVVRGRVRRGRLVVDAPLDLPDDTEVELTVVFGDRDELEEADRARLHQALHASKAQLERGEVSPIEAVLDEL